MRLIALALLLAGAPFDSGSWACTHGRQEKPAPEKPSTVDLKYGGAKDASIPVTAEFTLTLKITGTDAIVQMVRGAEAFFSFEKIRVRANGQRRIASAEKNKVQVKIEVDEARVDGKYDDEPYEFDFEKSSPPDDLQKDKLKQVCWTLGMSGRDYTLRPRGEYRSNDPNQDAWGEALDTASVPAVRLPENVIEVGATWESKWQGERKQKDNDGQFEYVQKATIEKIETRNDRKCARISFETTGKLVVPREKRDKNQKKGDTTFEASGWIELDLRTGLALASEAKGKVHAYAAFNNEDGGADHELDIVSTIEGKVTLK